MLERISALAGTSPVETDDLRLMEARGFSLIQVARPDKSARQLLGNLPQRAGVTASHNGRTLFNLGAGRWWVVGPEGDPLANELQGRAFVTPLSHSRTRILLEGTKARDVLARCAAVDFRAASFPVHAFAMTGIHHTPVLIHCIGQHAFHIYVMRTFALSVWEWLVDAQAS